jgi:hypothetical protein
MKLLVCLLPALIAGTLHAEIGGTFESSMKPPESGLTASTGRTALHRSCRRTSRSRFRL